MTGILLPPLMLGGFDDAFAIVIVAAVLVGVLGAFLCERSRSEPLRRAEELAVDVAEAIESAA